jgi:hypothetical protein
MTAETANKPDAKQRYEEKKREEKHHDKAVEDSFPASDPASTTQPGSGITGPEVIDEKKKPAK